jgi:hypothetical protein
MLNGMDQAAAATNENRPMKTNLEKTATVPAPPKSQRLSWITARICHASLVMICLLPASVLGHGVAQVYAGAEHTLVIKKDGTLWGWGHNSYGQLGDGTTKHRSSPVQVGRDSDWASVYGGESHTVALKTDGTLHTWGSNLGGALGEGVAYRFTPGPVLFPSAPAFLTMAPGQGKTARLELEATPGAVYQLETSTDLREWTLLRELSITTDGKHPVEAEGEALARFFRVMKRE